MRSITLFIFLAISTSAGWAADQTDTEVQYLLSYVENSGCTFHRNGSDHDSAGAADHLRLKYSRGAKYAGSAEQFIDRLASKSSWTGRTYTVTCGSTTEPSGDWLHRALDEYRSGH